LMMVEMGMETGLGMGGRVVYMVVEVGILLLKVVHY
jgi:hypothetical protein